MTEATPEEMKEAQRLYVKQATEEPHGYMMGPWENITLPVRETWIALARRKLEWRLRRAH